MNVPFIMGSHDFKNLYMYKPVSMLRAMKTTKCEDCAHLSLFLKFIIIHNLLTVEKSSY